MPIAPLPDDTVRLLGSSTVVATPVDVVKELLENAIDAEASTVAVLVSPNTVDRIEVRDNGDGISLDDYNALGRPGHTSKITSFQELQTLGGATLGFRGQALASINALGTVTITTRTARDPTAVTLKLFPGVGGLESQQRASAPVGTTVSVSRLYSRMPVREQFAVKESQKSLARISRLLHSYALARPQIRLSFRVSGANNKRSWLYTPAQGATIKEAIYQVFGNEVMHHSTIRTIFSRPGCDNGDTDRVEEKLAIEAMLPKPGADQSKVSSKIHKASFFSVDSRPVSNQSGTMKKLQSIFKDYYSRSLRSADTQKTWKDPCLCVNIRCSPGAYDSNIEPSKSIVLFAEESLLLSLFELLLSELYAQVSSDPFATVETRQLLCRRQTRTPPPSSSGPVDVKSTPLSLAEGAHDQVDKIEQSLVESGTPLVYERHKALRLPCDTVEDLNFRQGHQPTHTFSAKPSIMPVSKRQADIDHSTLELVSPRPQQDPPSMPSSAVHQQTTEPARNPRPRGLAGQAGSRGFVVNMSTDPDVSSDEEAEMLASRFRGRQDRDSQQEAEDADPREGLNPWSIARLTASARHAGGVRNPSTNTQNLGHLYEPWGASVTEAFGDNLPILRPYGNLPVDYDSPRPVRQGISDMSSQFQQLPGFRHPSPPGVNDNARPAAHDALPNLISYHSGVEEDVEPGGLVQTRLAFEGQRGSRKRSGNQVQIHIDDIPSRSIPSYRKPKKVKYGRRSSPAVNTAGNLTTPMADVLGSPRLTQSEISQTGHRSPHQPVQESGITSGDSNSRLSERPFTSSSSPSPGKDKWFDGDSRKYLMMRQCSEANHQRKGRQPLKRAKSDMLPLEKIPDREMTQHLVLTIMPDTAKLGRVWEATTGVDPFCSNCRMEIDLSKGIALEDITDIEVKLRIVLADWTEKALGQNT